MADLVAYNSNDAVQQQFLSSLALGESGANGGPMVGVGGANLAGSSTDQWGFPQWGGVGSGSSQSHAAGLFQFQPATWDSVASTYGLNFGNASDQQAGAWYLAEQTYQQKTGGSLESDLQAGKFSSVQSALASIWPSVTGNGAAPQGLASDLANKIGAVIGGGSPSGGALGGTPGAPAGGGILGAIDNFFVRFGLVIAGGLIVVVALWQLLSNQGIVPSPGDTAKAATKAVALI